MLLLCSCNTKKVDATEPEAERSSAESEIQPSSTKITIDRTPRPSKQLPFFNSSNGEVRYSADSITHDDELNQIILTGSVWYIQGRYLIDGREDQTTVLILNAADLSIIRAEGHFEKTILIE